MKPTPGSIQAAVLGALLFASAACAPPTAEDVRIGRQAMPISEVSLMLGGGSSQKSIIADVNRRHIPERISAALELELSDKGAGPGLIAALKDEKNILTRNQKHVFAKWMNDRATQPRPNHGSEQSVAVAQSNAEQREHQRLLGLQQENSRNIERNQALQADRERAQAKSTNRFEAGRNASGIYATPRTGIGHSNQRQQVTTPGR
jgi:hypothetical protein